MVVVRRRVERMMVVGDLVVGGARRGAGKTDKFTDLAARAESGTVDRLRRLWRVLKVIEARKVE